jgi:hypothetical protein
MILTRKDSDELQVFPMPEIMAIVEVLERFDQSSFITKQLLKICCYLDYSDEAGRRVLFQFLISKLVTSKDETFELILNVLLKMESQSEVTFCIIR